MPTPIPFPRSHSVINQAIEAQLTRVLNQLQDTIIVSDVTVLWVSCRLNRTNSTVPNPVFVGWVESLKAKNTRLRRGYRHAPDDTRLDDSHVSSLYIECVTVPQATVVRRNWQVAQADPTSQQLGVIYYDESHRRSIAIKLEDVYVGTLNAGFRGDPQQYESAIKDCLIDWAQKDSSALTSYIRDNLDPSGLDIPQT